MLKSILVKLWRKKVFDNYKIREMKGIWGTSRGGLTQRESSVFPIQLIDRNVWSVNFIPLLIFDSNSKESFSFQNKFFVGFSKNLAPRIEQNHYLITPSWNPAAIAFTAIPSDKWEKHIQRTWLGAWTFPMNFAFTVQRWMMPLFPRKGELRVRIGMEFVLSFPLLLDDVRNEWSL